MITGSNPYPISHDSGHPEIDATGTGYNPADAAAQWDAAIADGAITKVELEQHPELAHHIEVTLGYGSIDVFFNGACQKGIKWNFTKFLVRKNGEVYNRYAPTTKTADLKADIAKLLAE